MDWLLKLAESGTDVPFLATIPSVLPGAEWLWSAWRTLSSARLDTERPIPVSEILAYAVYHEIDSRSERHLLLKAIITLDRVYREHSK